MDSRNYTRAVRMWTQQFPVGTDICAEIAACIDAAVAEERAAVVAFLRSLPDGYYTNTGMASAIERVEHRPKEEP